VEEPFRERRGFFAFLRSFVKVRSRLKITFEWRSPFEGDPSPTYLSSLVVKIKENIKVGIGVGNWGRRDKAEIFFLASFGGGDIFSGW